MEQEERRCRTSRWLAGHRGGGGEGGGGGGGGEREHPRAANIAGGTGNFISAHINFNGAEDGRHKAQLEITNIMTSTSSQKSMFFIL